MQPGKWKIGCVDRLKRGQRAEVKLLFNGFGKYVGICMSDLSSCMYLITLWNLE